MGVLVYRSIKNDTKDIAMCSLPPVMDHIEMLCLFARIYTDQYISFPVGRMCTYLCVCVVLLHVLVSDEIIHIHCLHKRTCNVDQ